MFSYTLQDWTTVTIDHARTSLTQPEAGWMSFEAFSDIVFWCEMASVIGDTRKFLIYETAPSKDEALFQEMGSIELATSLPAVQVTPILLTNSPSAYLGKWVRWRLVRSSSDPGAPWGAMFRVLCAAKATPAMSV